MNEAPKKQEHPKKKKSPAALIAASVCAAIAVVCGSLCIYGAVAWNRSIEAYQNGDYSAAYHAISDGPFSFVPSLLMHDSDEAKIRKAYILNVLRPENRAAEASDVLAGGIFSDEEKARITDLFPGAGLLQVGAVVPLGSYDVDPEQDGLETLEWIVLKVDRKNGAVLLLSKDVVGFDDFGWNARGKEENTSYAESNLAEWCADVFYTELNSDPDFRGKILTYTVKTAASKEGVSSGDPVNARVFAPSIEDLEEYLSGDMAKYRAASTAPCAKDARIGTYWLRNAGDAPGFAAGVDKNGEILDSVSVTAAYGIRPMLWYDIGTSN